MVLQSLICYIHLVFEICNFQILLLLLKLMYLFLSNMSYTVNKLNRIERKSVISSLLHLVELTMVYFRLQLVNISRNMAYEWQSVYIPDRNEMTNHIMSWIRYVHHANTN